MRIDISQDHMACPICSRLYALGCDDYCEDDGEPLVRRFGTMSAEQEPTPQAEPAGTPEAAADTPQQASSDEDVHTPEPEQGPTPKSHAFDEPPPAADQFGPDNTDANPEPAVESHDSRLDELKRRFGFGKKSSTKSDQQYSSTSETRENHFASDSGEDKNNPLPPSLVEAGWELSGQLISHEAADLWPVRRAAGDSGVFRRYRAWVLTAPAVYDMLRSQPCVALTSLLDHGTVNLKGHAQASYELTNLPADGQPLPTWLSMAPPSEAKALALLPHLVAMLNTVASYGLQPISFQSAQLHRYPDGHLVLDNCGALARTDQHLTDYRPELDQNALLSRVWSAPEIGEQLVASPKGAVFSAGQVLAQALWGQPIDTAALRAGLVPFASIEDQRLARVLQGCLWVHTIEGRWDLAQLSAAASAPIDQLPAAEDWSQLGPRAMGNAFGFAGRSFWRVEELLEATVQAQNWSQALSQLNSILDWIEDGSPWASLATELRGDFEGGHSADWVLVRLAHGVQPKLPLTWRSLDFSDGHVRNSLISLAQRNLSTNTTPEEAELLDRLFRADLRGAFILQESPVSSDG